MMVSNSMGVNRPRRGLAASAVVGAFDPGDDRDAQLVAGGPALPVEDVLLQQREERFHGGVVAGGADLAHRADHAVTGERPVQLPRTELRCLGRECRMQPATSPRRATALSSACDGEAGLHPVESIE